MKAGTLDITNLKAGSTDINKVYAGSILVWERGGGPIAPIIQNTFNQSYYAFEQVYYYDGLILNI